MGMLSPLNWYPFKNDGVKSIYEVQLLPYNLHFLFYIFFAVKVKGTRTSFTTIRIW